MKFTSILLALLFSYPAFSETLQCDSSTDFVYGAAHINHLTTLDLDESSGTLKVVFIANTLPPFTSPASSNWTIHFTFDPKNLPSLQQKLIAANYSEWQQDGSLQISEKKGHYDFDFNYMNGDCGDPGDAYCMANANKPATMSLATSCQSVMSEK